MNAGDEEAFRELFARYRTIVYSTVYTILLDPEAAEKVVAETFREARLTARPFLRTRCSVSGWLTHLARLCIAGLLGETVLEPERALWTDGTLPTG